MHKKKKFSPSSVSPLVSFIMGSSTDLPFMQEGIELLESFRIPIEVKVVSAHRSPRWMQNYSLKVEQRGLKVIVAGAGGAAHLPGMVASLTNLPVIGVPIQVGKLRGLDSILSMVQMPKGVPVATVALDNSFNAAFLATKILGLSSKKIHRISHLFRKEQRDMVTKMNKELKLKGKNFSF